MEREGANGNWIDAIDRIGRQRAWLRVSQASTSSGQMLIHHFCADPENRRGLLAVIVELAIAGHKCVIPSAILARAEQWDADSKRDALGLRLAGEPLAQEDIRAIVHALGEGDPRFAEESWRAMRMAGSCSAEQQAHTALFMLAELHVDNAESMEAATIARGQLAEFLTKRPSSLANPDVWRRLGLPDRQ
jgi:hypothetical protein